jgi:shikimate 5-dehydrogenase
MMLRLSNNRVIVLDWWNVIVAPASIAHSASPAMHEMAAEALGWRCHYQLIETAGAGAAQ